MIWPLLSQDPTTTEFAFWMCAFGGTFFFLLRVAMFVIAGVGGDDFDTGDGHVDGDVHDHAGHNDAHGSHDTMLAFKLFSLNSFSSFVMMFGWSGLAALKEYHLADGVAVFIAFAVGGLTMMLTSYMFLWAHRLTSEGADFKIDSLVGERGTVYQRIPENGRGKIQITANGTLRELHAESAGQSAIESFAVVVVKKITSPTLVMVEPVSEE